MAGSASLTRPSCSAASRSIQEVCAACHSIKHVAFRDLKALGYNEDEVKAIAAKFTVTAKDPLTGEVKDRPGVPADRFPPWPMPARAFRPTCR
jgi:cytochrome c1